MLQFGVLSTFFEMLDRCSDETKQVTCHALARFAPHGMVVCSTSILVTDFNVDDIQRVLSHDGYLRKLAKRAQSHAPGTRDGAIIALVALGDTQGAGRRGSGFRWSEAQRHNTSEVGCHGGHQDSENDQCPRSSTQPEVDCSFRRVGAGPSHEDQ